jgi:hypothetical protein
MDDRPGVAVARAKGFAATGTLGLLDLGGRRKLLKLEEAFATQNNKFRYPPENPGCTLGAAKPRKL